MAGKLVLCANFGDNRKPKFTHHRKPLNLDKNLNISFLFAKQFDDKIFKTHRT